MLPLQTARLVLRLILAAAYFAAGVLHLAAPAPFLSITPGWVPWPQAVIAATYIGTQDAFDAILDVFKHPRDGHLQYAITCAMGSRTLRPFWENNPSLGIEKMLKKALKIP